VITSFFIVVFAWGAGSEPNDFAKLPMFLHGRVSPVVMVSLADINIGINIC